MDTSWIHPFLADIAECVSCGKCLPDCPLYDYHRREEWSPRGKLNVLKWSSPPAAARLRPRR